MALLSSAASAPVFPTIPATSTPCPSSGTLSSKAHKAALAALDVNIQALPQELQDELLHHTMLAAFPPVHKVAPYYNSGVYPKSKHLVPTSHDDPMGKVWIDRNYKPPALLQVDRKTRNKFAQLYYTSCLLTGIATIYRSHQWLWHPSRQDALYRRWYASLSLEHQDLVKDKIRRLLQPQT